MEGLGVILFLVAILVSIFEKAGRQGTKPRGPQPPGWPQPPTRRPPARPRYGPEPEAPRPLPPPGQGGEGKAADMIPEDFWRELTGQARRPVPVERHEAEEVPSPDLPSWDEEAVARQEAQSREVTVREERSLEEYRRPEVVRRPPDVVTLEAPPPPPELRHAQFHRREELRQAKPPVATAAAPVHPLQRRFRNRESLREGFILQEVLGRPRGLEEEEQVR